MMNGGKVIAKSWKDFAKRKFDRRIPSLEDAEHLVLTDAWYGQCDLADLFGAKRLQRIDQGGAACRKIAGKRGGPDQDRRDAYIGHWIERSDAEQ